MRSGWGSRERRRRWWQRRGGEGGGEPARPQSHEREPERAGPNSSLQFTTAGRTLDPDRFVVGLPAPPDRARDVQRIGVAPIHHTPIGGPGTWYHYSRPPHRVDGPLRTSHFRGRNPAASSIAEVDPVLALRKMDGALVVGIHDSRSGMYPVSLEVGLLQVAQDRIGDDVSPIPGRTHLEAAGPAGSLGEELRIKPPFDPRHRIRRRGGWDETRNRIEDEWRRVAEPRAARSATDFAPRHPATDADGLLFRCLIPIPSSHRWILAVAERGQRHRCDHANCQRDGLGRQRLDRPLVSAIGIGGLWDHRRLPVRRIPEVETIEAILDAEWRIGAAVTENSRSGYSHGGRCPHSAPAESTGEALEVKRRIDGKEGVVPAILGDEALAIVELRDP